MWYDFLSWGPLLTLLGTVIGVGATLGWNLYQRRKTVQDQQRADLAKQSEVKIVDSQKVAQIVTEQLEKVYEARDRWYEERESWLVERIGYERRISELEAENAHLSAKVAELLEFKARVEQHLPPPAF